MEAAKIREGLRTALLLSQVASRAHCIDIDSVGEVRISRHSVQLRSGGGDWQELTHYNLEIHLRELQAEPRAGQQKRTVPQLVFSAA